MSITVFWIIAAVVIVLLLVGLLFKVLFRLFIRLLPVALIVLFIWWLVVYGPINC